MTMVRWFLGAAGLVAAGGGCLFALCCRDERRMQRLWQRLDAAGAGGGRRFTIDMVDGVPEPARRYLAHSIRRGAPLSRVGVFRMSGEIRRGPDEPWNPMAAHEILVPGVGFLWRPEVQSGGLRLSGGDYYHDGDGGQAFHLWRLVPLLHTGGADVSRSQCGRLALESVLNPASMLPGPGSSWSSVDERTAAWHTRLDGDEVVVAVTVDENGALRTATVPRWSDRTAGGGYGWVPFSLEVLEDHQFGDYVLPRRLRVGWELGTERELEFFRATIEDAVLY